MDSPLKIVYASCTENPTTAFEAPFTKVYIGTAKEGRTTEELMGLALKVTSDPTALADQKGRVSQPIWGEAVESPGTVLCISGWDSIEAVSKLPKALTHFLRLSWVTSQIFRPTRSNQRAKTMTKSRPRYSTEWRASSSW